VKKELFNFLFGTSSSLLDLPGVLVGDKSGNIFSSGIGGSEFNNPFSLKEQLHNVILTSRNEESIEADTIVFLGNQGKVVIISFENSKKLQKEYQLALNAPISSSLCFEKYLLINANGSLYIAELASGDLPLSLMLSPIASPINVHSMSIGPKEFISVLTKNGNLLFLKLPSKEILKQNEQNLVTTQQKLKNQLGMLGEISNKQRILKIEQQKLNEALTRTNVSIHIFNEMIKSKTIEVKINGFYIPSASSNQCIGIKSALSNRGKFDFPPNWHYAVHVDIPDRSFSADFSIPIENLPRGSTWKVDNFLPIEELKFPVKVTSYLYYSKTVQSNDDKSRDQARSRVAEKNLDLLDFCIGIPKKSKQIFSPKNANAYEISTIFHDILHPKNKNQKDSAVPTFMKPNFALKMVIGPLDQQITANNLLTKLFSINMESSENSFQMISPLDDKITWKVQPLHTAFYEISCQVAENKLSLVRSSLIHRILPIINNHGIEIPDKSIDPSVLKKQIEEIQKIKEKMIKSRLELEQILSSLSQNQVITLKTALPKIWNVVQSYRQTYFDLRQITVQ